MSMITSTSVRMTDDEFVSAFMQCRLSSADFDHRGHLRIAWLLLNRYPVEEAVEATCAGIQRIATHFGAPGKYNRTMSEALVRLIAHGRVRASHTGFEQFLAANPEFVHNVRGVLAHYYSSDRLSSNEAKRFFVPPDLQALP